MGPLTLELYKKFEDAGQHEATAYLRKCAHFILDRDFLERAIDVADAFPMEYFTDRLPHTDCVFEMTNRTGVACVFTLGPDMSLDGVVAISAYMAGRGLRPLGHWRPRTKMIGLTQSVRDEIVAEGTDPKDSYEFSVLGDAATILNTVCELLVEPRIVTLDKPPRHMRRRADRVLPSDGDPTVWNSVKWNITGQTTGKSSGRENGPQKGKAYHLVRGHWRNYGERQTANGERRAGKPGWWVWVDSHHSGNPAFGIVGHKYEPSAD